MSKKPHVGVDTHYEVRLEHDAVLLKLESVGPKPHLQKIEFYCGLEAYQALELANVLKNAVQQISNQS